MRTANRFVSTLLPLFILSGCDKPLREAPTFSASRAVVSERLDRAAAVPEKQTRAVDQKLIRTGDLRIEVDRAETAAARADTIARRHGGLVTDMRMVDDERGKQTIALSLGIPADRFNDALTDLRGLGIVKSEGMRQEDVTREYSDLATRLAVKEDEVTRLRELLNHRTGKLKDVLEVERELNRAITELEQMKGERQYYDGRIAQSTVTVTFLEAGVSLPGSALTIGEAFRRSIAVFSASVAWVIYVATFLTPWLVLTTIVWWLARVIRNHNRPGGPTMKDAQ